MDRKTDDGKWFPCARLLKQVPQNPFHTINWYLVKTITYAYKHIAREENQCYYKQYGDKYITVKPF